MRVRSPASGLVLAACAVLAVAQSARASSPAPRPRVTAVDIIATLKANGKFNMLLSLIETAGMTATLQGKGPYTLFAPTDSAFAALPPAKLGVLREKASATAVLRYYVVPEMVMSAEFTSKADAQSYAAFKTLGGSEIKVHMARHVGKEFATLQKTDIMASNGVVHVVDKVMTP